MTIFDVEKERERQETNDDAKFYGYSLFFFQLRVPGKALGLPDTKIQKLVFPLAVAPESYSLEEPFTVSVTPGTNGGLIVEENGIIQRRIRLNGTTGARPRPLNASAGFGNKPEVESSAPSRGKFVTGYLSGQRHFHFLQDKVFRAYADLKRDPTYAKQVQLIFHNLKDDEHWLVVPETFSLQRAAGRGPLYAYEISLIAVSPAEVLPTQVVPVSKSWWDSAAEGLAKARSALAKISGVIQFINQVAEKVKRVVSDVLAIVDDVIGLVNEVTNVINGIARIATDVFNRIRDVARRARAAAVAVVVSASTFGDVVGQAFANLADYLEEVASIPSIRNEIRDRIDNIRTGGRNNRARALRASEANNISRATTESELARSGSAPTVADVVAQLSSLDLGVEIPAFNNIESYQVQGSDTLPSISARLLGSAELWWVIAEVNRLRAPYISDVPIPGTVQRGATIFVPTTQQTANNLGQSGVPSTPDDDLLTQLFFRDALVAPSSRFPNRIDLVLDAEKGNKDILYVAGIENLKQGIRTRLETVLGENVLYPNLGLERVIGMGEPDIDVEILRVFVSQAISADNRVANLGSVRVSNTESLDAYNIEVDARVRGLTAPVLVNVTQSL